MDDLDIRRALDEMAKALQDAGLQNTEILEHPQHVAVVTPHGDYVIWVSPWGTPVMYTVQGVGIDVTCAGVGHVVNLLRKLTTP
jgi:hypothetical protein